MSKWFAVSTALILFAVTTPASADWFASARRVSHTTAASSVGGPMVMHGDVYGAKAGYPFYSGCCEPRSCCSGLWAGFCHGPRCHRHHGFRFRGGCGSACGGCATGCGKGAVQSCGKGAVQSCGKGAVQSCGKGAVQSCGKGCGVSHGCGHRRRFGWFHRRGCGCDVIDSGCGCGSKGYAKGGYSTPVYSTPMPVYQDEVSPMDTETPAVPQPEPVSLRSANLRFSLPLRNSN